MEMIPDEHNYLAVIELMTDIYNFDRRVDEICKIREWLDELVKYQTDQYSWDLTVTSLRIYVWFKEEKHATMCRLRWTS